MVSAMGADSKILLKINRKKDFLAVRALHERVGLALIPRTQDA